MCAACPPWEVGSTSSTAQSCVCVWVCLCVLLLVFGELHVERFPVYDSLGQVPVDASDCESGVVVLGEAEEAHPSTGGGLRVVHNLRTDDGAVLLTQLNQVLSRPLHGDVTHVEIGQRGRHEGRWGRGVEVDHVRGERHPCGRVERGGTEGREAGKDRR
jgi:hypothetical protein